MSMAFEFEKGVQYMMFNVVGFLILALLVKTRIHLVILGNIYILIGATTIFVLTYYSGGVWSAIYPWVISIPVLALLVVNRISGIIWAIISFAAMLWIGAEAYSGVEFPIEYNIEMRTLWFIFILPGLLLMIVVMSLVFVNMHRKAVQELEASNSLLREQKKIIKKQSWKLEQLIEEKDNIIQIMVHDLRNPLANINMLTDLVKNEKDIDQKEKYYVMLKRSSEGALELVSKILEADMLEQQHVMPNLQDLSVNEVLSHTVSTMQLVGERKSIKLNWKNTAKQDNVLADPAYLKPIFDNLISNAIKFSPKDTTITVRSFNNNGHIQVNVEDLGQGILETEVNLLFQKFSKLSARPTSGESSSGLGLSLVKKYVEQIHGKVWYEPNKPNGSKFIVELPIA
jgi:signal transduction histidine kinase